MTIDDLTLNRYVEQDFDGASLLRVERLLETDQPARAKVQMLRGTLSVLGSTFGKLKEAKPPEGIQGSLAAIAILFV